MLTVWLLLGHTTCQSSQRFLAGNLDLCDGKREELRHMDAREGELYNSTAEQALETPWRQQHGLNEQL
jgi:hypothetical protein